MVWTRISSLFVIETFPHWQREKVLRKGEVFISGLHLIGICYKHDVYIGRRRFYPVSFIIHLVSLNLCSSLFQQSLCVPWFNFVQVARCEFSLSKGKDDMKT